VAHASACRVGTLADAWPPPTVGMRISAQVPGRHACARPRYRRYEALRIGTPVRGCDLRPDVVTANSIGSVPPRTAWTEMRHVPGSGFGMRNCCGPALDPE